MGLRNGAYPSLDQILNRNNVQMQLNMTTSESIPAVKLEPSSGQLDSSRERWLIDAGINAAPRKDIMLATNDAREPITVSTSVSTKDHSPRSFDRRMARAR